MSSPECVCAVRVAGGKQLTSVHVQQEEVRLHDDMVMLRGEDAYNALPNKTVRNFPFPRPFWRWMDITSRAHVHSATFADPD